MTARDEPPAILTVGHSTHPIEVFLELLAGAGVERLVDVRRFPASRRSPQFAREALARALAGRGIAYVHAPELGGRRNPRPGSPNGAWRVAGFRGYADHMATDEFRRAAERLRAEARAARTAVLCAEAHPSRCHRRLIADWLVARGERVEHLLPGGRRLAHELHPAARVLPGGDLVYPPATDAAGGLYDAAPPDEP